MNFHFTTQSITNICILTKIFNTRDVPYIILNVRVLQCLKLNKGYLDNKIKIKYLETYYLELVEYCLRLVSPRNLEEKSAVTFKL